MRKKMITIITLPSSIKEKTKYYLTIIFKNFVKIIFYYILPAKNRKITSLKYSGHYAVTRSIVNGFKKINISFNINPNKKNISEIVYVPSGVEALKYAIDLKKDGKIKKIIAGPNIAIFPDEIRKIKNYKYIDLYLQPSEWVINWWKEIDPWFPIKIKSWYAGVDINFWKPKSNHKKNILLYRKNVPENFYNEVKKFFEINNFNVKTIKYGKYKKNDYLKTLNKSQCLVHLTESESQGISLAEAWATNTPTIVWNPETYIYQGICCNKCSSSPYLTKETGEFFKNINDLKKIFSNWNPNRYSPRTWVIKNMSDEICSEKLKKLLIN